MNEGKLGISMWKVCVKKPFLNCQRIYPIQQEKVQSLVKNVALNPNVIRVIIFGSSTTNRCHIKSDVDVYIVMKTNEYPFTRAFDFTCDVWTNYTADDKLKNEIKNGGVIVYERTK